MKFRSGLMALIVSVGILSVGCSSENENRFTGFVEVDTSIITSSMSGTIKSLDAMEGDLVEKDQIIGMIDSDIIDAQISAVDYQIESQNLAVDLLEDQIDDKDIEKASAALSENSSQLTYANQALSKAEDDLNDSETLFSQGVISEATFKNAKLLAEQYLSNVQRLSAQREALSLQYSDVLEGVDARQLTQLKLSTLQLEAQKKILEKQKVNAELIASEEGVLTHIYVDVNNFVNQGTKIGEISDYTKPYVIFYVNNEILSRLSVGSKISVYQDHNSQKFEGEVYYISNTAQFTPKNVTSKADRQELVYEVKANLSAENGFMPGMMVDCVVENE